MSQEVQTQTAATEEEPTKMLGAHVPISVYWDFKKAAASRNEQLKDALQHAVRMYVDAGKEK